MREGMLAQGNTVMRLFVASKVRLIVSWGVYDHFFLRLSSRICFTKYFAHTHTYTNTFFLNIYNFTLYYYTYKCAMCYE